ncbi:MAG TPA: hypothetical protein VLQ46_01860 [Casimicrobiaceae bacterium]|nr:hypothetical protein [Casimicrobiaceae bacterium]
MEPTTTSELSTWTPLSEPATAFAAGMLALAAALAGAFASTMAAPLFAAMLAVGLGANAGMLTVHAAAPTRWALSRALGWGLVVVGWIGFAVLLLHTPLAYPGTLREVAAGLVVLGAGMRLLDRLAQDSKAAPLLAVTLFFSAAAIAVVWFGVLPPLAERPLQAIAIAASLELCAAGTAWLEEAWLERGKRRAALARGVTRSRASYFELRRT